MKNNTPSFWQICRNPTHFIAFGFGSGCMPFAPGTFGSLAALPIYFLMAHLPGFFYWLFVAALFYIGCWVSDVTGRDLNEADHSGIVIDEIVGMLIVLYAIPAGWIWPIIAFGLFRLFDITKPYPIRQLEQRYHNGYGVMIDDIMAAIYAALALRIISMVLQ